MNRLPKPDYRREASDPEWLVQAVQFHGHLGPWATAGLRAGMAARRAVEADGYFDVAVAVEGPLVKPPQSCFLDGVQVSTGATWGKRNLQWVKGDQLVVRIRNTRTGKAAEVRPTAALMGLLTSFKPRPKAVAAKGAAAGRDEDHAGHSLETIARKIAQMPEKDILSIRFPGK